MQVTRKQLFDFLQSGGQDGMSYAAWREGRVDDGEPSIDEKTFDALVACNIKYILTGEGLSAEHLGGDDLVSMAEDIVSTIKEGYEIALWYGPNTETLIVGFRPDQMTLTD